MPLDLSTLPDQPTTVVKSRLTLRALPDQPSNPTSAFLKTAGSELAAPFRGIGTAASRLGTAVKAGATGIFKGVPAGMEVVRSELIPQVLAQQAAEDQRVAALREAQQGHPIASTLGGITGTVPSFLVGGGVTQPILKAIPLIAQLEKAGVAGKIAAEAIRSGVQFGTAEALQGHPEEILRAIATGAAFAPAGLGRSVLERAAIGAGSVGATSAALAPPGQRVVSGAIGAVGGGLGGALSPQIIGARAIENLPGVAPESFLIPAERISIEEAAAAAREGLGGLPGAGRTGRLKTAAQLAMDRPLPPGTEPSLPEVGLSTYGLTPEAKPSILYPEGRIPRTRTSEGGFVNIPKEPEVVETLAKTAALPATAGEHPTSSPHVERILTALREAKPVRGEQEALYTKARSERIARVLAIRKRLGGERGYYAELGQLKGQLPKAQFESLRPKVNQADIDALFNDVNAANLGAWEPLTAKEGLVKLLQGVVPTRTELSLLHEVFGPEFTKAVMDQRPTMRKLADLGIEIANLPRSLMASFDISAPFRQGLFLIGRPKEWMTAFGNMLKQFVSERSFQDSQVEISQRPTYQVMRQARLALTDLGPILTKREERFMSQIGERIPILKYGVRASNRAYVGFLNRLRADVFDDLLEKGKVLGVAENPKFLSSLGSFVNAATGRGPLGMFERQSILINSIFFSPKLMASRLALLNPAYYVSLEPTVRREAVKSLLTMLGTGATALSLTRLNGSDVGTDPRSADFGKMKVGNTRYDLWGGFQQPMVAAFRLVSGKMVSSVTGREFILGEGYKSTTRFDILQRYLESKEAPIVSFVTALLKGQTSIGQPLNVPVEVIDRFIPMFIQDIFEVGRERGIQKSFMGLPSAVGIGVQTYGSEIPQATTTPTGRPKISFRQPPGLGETILNRLTGTRISNIPVSMHPALRVARMRELKNAIAVDKIKRLVLEDGNPRMVGRTRIFLQKGIVKTKTFGKKETPLRVYERNLR